MKHFLRYSLVMLLALICGNANAEEGGGLLDNFEFTSGTITDNGNQLVFDFTGKNLEIVITGNITCGFENDICNSSTATLNLPSAELANVAYLLLMSEAEKEGYSSVTINGTSITVVMTQDFIGFSKIVVKSMMKIMLDDEDTGYGMLESPLTPNMANIYAGTLPSGASTEEDVFIKGKIAFIKEAFGAKFGNATFYISLDGNNDFTFYVYRAFFLENKKWEEGNTQIQVGDDVIICGKLTNYKGTTPETVQYKAYIYSLNGNTGTAEVGALYSWEGGAEGATEVGGKATYMSGPEGVDRVNYKNGDYYTLSINGKKANMGTEASNNGGYIQIDLEKELKTGDAIELTGYINKNEAGKEASIFFQFENGDGVDDDYIYGDADNIEASVGGKISTHTFTVPAASDGSKFFKMSRNKASTNIFLTKLVVTRGGSSGISDVKTVRIADNAIYNLAGQKVGKDYKGIVIINGRKMIQK